MTRRLGLAAQFHQLLPRSPRVAEQRVLSGAILHRRRDAGHPVLRRGTRQLGFGRIANIASTAALVSAFVVPTDGLKSGKEIGPSLRNT